MATTNDARRGNGRPVFYLTSLYRKAAAAGLVNPPTLRQMRDARKMHVPADGIQNLRNMAEAIATIAIGNPELQGTSTMKRLAARHLVSTAKKIVNLVAHEWK